MKWYWIIPISLAIVGWFGIFWTMNLADAEFSFDISIDKETIEYLQENDYCLMHYDEGDYTKESFSGIL